MRETIKRDGITKQDDAKNLKKKRREGDFGLLRFRALLKQDANRKKTSESFIGIDLGDKRSCFCVLDAGKEILFEGALSTTVKGFEAYFGSIRKSKIALEVGTHSAWVTALLEGMGHEVVVANPRKMESIHKNKRKDDKVDARTLARLVRADPELLHPIRHRGVKVRQDLVLLRARDNVVCARSRLINSVRGMVKSLGGRIPACSAESFEKHAMESLPEEIRGALMPMVETIAFMTKQIKRYDKQVQRTAQEEYPETGLLSQVPGVGHLTALAYVLTLEKPERFAQSRDVGAYVGLIPKQDDSGETTKQLRITKTGDRMLRRLLVSSAHYILGPFGEDSDLRRFGLKLSERGGKNAKKRAVVAVARKVGVLLHRLWKTGEAYESLHLPAMSAVAKG
jgi:transposase